MNEFLILKKELGPDKISATQNTVLGIMNEMR